MLIIFYAYYETPHSKINFDFFANHGGIINSENILYFIIINGYNNSVNIPDYKNIIILYRQNSGLDFGAYNSAIKYLSNIYNCPETKLPFDYFIFLNCGTIGPFVPRYYSDPWPSIFINKLTNNIKLVGPSLVCLPAQDCGKLGPKIEGYFFCTDKIGYQIFANNGLIFYNHPSKFSAIIYGEYALSNIILENNYNLDCLLYKYANKNWRDPKNWFENNNIHPSRENTYDGISIHPFEVIFHKWYWSEQPNKLVNFQYIQKYIEWAKKY